MKEILHFLSHMATNSHINRDYLDMQVLIRVLQTVGNFKNLFCHFPM